MRILRQLLLLTMIPLLALLSACGSDDGNGENGENGDGTTATPNDSDEAGDLTGETVVLYSGRDEELITPIVEAFETETGIEVDLRSGNSAEMAAQLLDEGDGTPAHVFYSQEVGAVGALAKADLLAPLPEETVNSVDERFQPDEDNLWVGVTGRSRVIVYNPDMLEDLGLDVPDGVLDLTDEQYRGNVAIVPGNAGFQAFITGFRVQDGEDAARGWLEDMLANDVASNFERNGDVLDAVDRGEIPIGLINHYYWARHENRDDLTAQLIFPSGDDPGALVNATAVGITKQAADNAAALALVDYLISPAGQQVFVDETWEYPVIDGVEDPDGIPPLSDLEGPELDLTDLDSLEATQALLREVGLLE